MTFFERFLVLHCKDTRGSLRNNLIQPNRVNCCLQTEGRMLKHFLQSRCILISHSRATSLNLYKAHLVRFSQIDFIIIWREPQVSLHWGNRVKIDMSFVRSFLFVITFLLSAELVLFLCTKTEYCPHYVCISFHSLT